MANKVTRITAIVVLVLVAIPGCKKNYREWEEQFTPIRKSLSAVEDKLTAIPAKTELAPHPSIKGKIVVFNRKNKLGKYEQANYYYRELIEIYATKPDEVGTVALLDCNETQKGFYKTAEGKEYPALVEDCGLTIIDHAKAAVIFRKLFEKTPAATQKVSKSGSVFSQSAFEDVTAFLKGLPRT